jgi:PhnB protein
VAESFVAPTGIIPHLVVDDAAAALEFYKQALGAVETMRVPAKDNKRIMHAEMEVNGTTIYVRDDFPEVCSALSQYQLTTPKALGGTPVTLHLYVPDCDAAVKRAHAAGAAISMEPQDTFWGARFGQIDDPFGHSWSFAHMLATARTEPQDAG